MTTSVHHIAKFIVQNSQAPVSNLKLQKLLYYVQGWHLGLKNEPLFKSRIEAWVHGPVVPQVFHHYREFKWTPISEDDVPARVGADASHHILAVIGAYGKMTASQLETLSHKEAPWLNARGGMDRKLPSKAEITHASMREYFGKLAHG